MLLHCNRASLLSAKMSHSDSAERIITMSVKNCMTFSFLYCCSFLHKSLVQLIRPRYLLLLLLILLFQMCAVVKAEKKVSVSEVVFDSSIEDIQWLGPNHHTVLCRTATGSLFRSTDSGRNWNEITSLLRKVTSKHSVSEVLVDNIVVDPTSRLSVLIVGRNRRHFISSDGALSFRAIEYTGSIHGFFFHPIRHNWALLSRWTEGCDAMTASSTTDLCRHDLFFTNDLGQTFKLMAPYVVQYSWGDIKSNQADRIYYSQHKQKDKSQPRTAGWSDTVHFNVLDTPYSSPRRLVSQGNKFLVSNGYIFVAQLKNFETQTVALMVSTDGGETFNEARLPVELQERSYTILDTSQNAVMLHVNHGHSSDQGMSVGNIYISDEKGLRYSLSLPKNIRTASGECEFDKVASLDGVYIANYREDPKSRTSGMGHTDLDIVREFEDEEMDALETGIDRRRRTSRKGKDEMFVKTVITFDKGGVWSYLKPPRVDSRGIKVDCQRAFSGTNNNNSSMVSSYEKDEGVAHNCWLNLHGITNYHRFAPFYCVENAVGLIMGTGNIGESLRYEEDEVNTYLSRDGGLNWVEAHKGAYIYEFGDHGGLIVMADDLKKTNQVVFSWNEGQSWYDFNLGDQSLNVDNIVIEPNSSSVEFLLYGTRGTAGVLYHLDFATLGQPACKGVWAADSVASDYQTWIPTDGRTGDQCILGKELTFTRRKQTSECFNGRDFNRPIEKRNCTCTERDYECEFGFTRLIDSVECVPEDTTLTQEDCTSSGVFYTNAYRKIPGDSCQGGWTPSKVPVMCPNNSPFSYRARMVLSGVPIIIGALALFTYINDNSRFKGVLSNYGFDTMSSAKYAILNRAARFVDAFDSTTDKQQDDSNYSFGTGSQQDRVGFQQFYPSDDEDDHSFIEAEQKIHDDDAPPLLDFSSSSQPLDDSFFLQGNRAASNMLHADHTAPYYSGSSNLPPSYSTEPVPRLNPPPSSTIGHPHVVRQFEML